MPCIACMRARTRSHWEALSHQSWHSQPAFANLDDYLFFTEPTLDQENACKAAEAAAQKPRKKPRCTKKERLARLEMFALWLEKNFSMTQIVALAKKHFNLGRRSAQLYVREVKRRWAEAAQKEDYLAHLWQSKLQYEACSHELFRALQATDDPKVKANLLRTNLGYLKAKDECMAVMQLHRRKAKRDQSPDSLRERYKRDGMVIMPLGELLERVDNNRRAWRDEFQKEFEELNGLAPPKCWFDTNGELQHEPDLRTKIPQTPPIPHSPPPGWGEEWQRREEAKAQAELRKELGLEEK
jgi:hypothetical protein